MESNTNNLTLLSLLQEEKALTKTNLALLQDFQEKWNISAFEAILETHLLTEAQLADILASRSHLQRLYAIANRKMTPESYESIDFFAARKFGVFPLGRHGSENKMKIALYDPTRQETIDFLSELYEEHELLVAERGIVIEAINRLYPLSCQIPHLKTLEVPDK